MIIDKGGTDASVLIQPSETRRRPAIECRQDQPRKRYPPGLGRAGPARHSDHLGCNGIAPAHQRRFFEPFSQVEDRLTRDKGVSVWPLAHSMMRMHGGGLTLTSQVVVGTTVEATCPAQRLGPNMTAMTHFVIVMADDAEPIGRFSSQLVVLLQPSKNGAPLLEPLTMAGLVKIRTRAIDRGIISGQRVPTFRCKPVDDLKIVGTDLIANRSQAEPDGFRRGVPVFPSLTDPVHTRRPIIWRAPP